MSAGGSRFDTASPSCLTIHFTHMFHSLCLCVSLLCSVRSVLWVCGYALVEYSRNLVSRSGACVCVARLPLSRCRPRAPPHVSVFSCCFLCVCDECTRVRCPPDRENFVCSARDPRFMSGRHSRAASSDRYGAASSDPRSRYAVSTDRRVDVEAAQRSPSQHGHSRHSSKSTSPSQRTPTHHSLSASTRVAGSAPVEPSTPQRLVSPSARMRANIQGGSREQPSHPPSRTQSTTLSASTPPVSQAQPSSRPGNTTFDRYGAPLQLPGELPPNAALDYGDQYISVSNLAPSRSPAKLDFTTWQRLNTSKDNVSRQVIHHGRRASLNAKSPTSAAAQVDTSGVVGQADALRLAMLKKHEHENLDSPNFLDTEWVPPAIQLVRAGASEFA